MLAVSGRAEARGQGPEGKGHEPLRYPYSDQAPHPPSRTLSTPARSILKQRKAQPKASSNSSDHAPTPRPRGVEGALETPVATTWSNPPSCEAWLWLTGLLIIGPVRFVANKTPRHLQGIDGCASLDQDMCDDTAVTAAQTEGVEDTKNILSCPFQTLVSSLGTLLS